MSYVISTIGSGDKAVKQFTVKCDEVGCKAHFDSKVGKGDAWQTVKAQGWFSDSAANHRCVDHKPARAARKTAEGKTPSKSAVAQTKAEKVASKPAGKASKKASVPASKATVQPTTFAGGQSIGKKARSAK